jgi:MFS superfamily sulfate permease-like transporter
MKIALAVAFTTVAVSTALGVSFATGFMTAASFMARVSDAREASRVAVDEPKDEVEEETVED